MLGGVVSMTILDALVVLFCYIESSVGILISLVLFLASFMMSMGPLPFIHA